VVVFWGGGSQPKNTTQTSNTLLPQAKTGLLLTLSN
jgi:hypothetical protein